MTFHNRYANPLQGLAVAIQYAPNRYVFHRSHFAVLPCPAFSGVLLKTYPFQISLYPAINQEMRERNAFRRCEPDRLNEFYNQCLPI